MSIKGGRAGGRFFVVIALMAALGACSHPGSIYRFGGSPTRLKAMERWIEGKKHTHERIAAYRVLAERVEAVLRSDERVHEAVVAIDRADSRDGRTEAQALIKVRDGVRLRQGELLKIWESSMRQTGVEPSAVAVAAQSGPTWGLIARLDADALLE